MNNKLEIGRYEAFFEQEINHYYQLTDSFKMIEENFIDSDSIKELVKEDIALKYFEEIKSMTKDLNSFESIIYGKDNYPKKLLDLNTKLYLLYYMGKYELINKPSIAIIGSRDASNEGLKRASKISKMLVKKGFVIISGLAEGIDTAAHKACLEENGQTIAVIGTSLNHCYPLNNKDLMNEIAKNHLLISQVPFIIYERLKIPFKKRFFIERNKTMSALANGTIIVEARDRSGTLSNARTVLKQGRPLFILNNNFENSNLQWPHELEALGAIRVKNIEDILINLSY
ncbi:DNA-processing protein DprA [Silvanigrella sp.]|jgi:DNA processing protein|uniref:DNA-processing protein DprA n=1 Tax=Silvanigrella sp. TaxID=2024976 RepID=UPI0037C971ED